MCTTPQICHTSALIVLSHNDRGVCSLIVEYSPEHSPLADICQNRTEIEEKLKIPTSEFY